MVLHLNSYKRLIRSNITILYKNCYYTNNNNKIILLEADMENQITDMSLQELKRHERRKKKNLLVINSLGGISLTFSLLSMFLIMTTLVSRTEDELMLVGLIFSTFVFSLIGIICGMIGYLKAKIFRKSGYYATTGIVLNLFGIILNGLEIFGTIAILLFLFF
jgi:hypothetical protein